MDKVFINETQNIKHYLNDIRCSCDEFDLTNPPLQQQIIYLNDIKGPVFKRLNDHFIQIWRIVEPLPKKEFLLYQKYYQKELVPLFTASPLNKRIYEKPLGYPGDYIMMNYYYDDSYEGESTFGKLVHRYSLELPVARANINRKEHFMNIFDELLTDLREARITAFGCGPAREIIEYLSKSANAQRCIFTCIDSEAKALDFVREQVANYKWARINYLDFNIINLLKTKTSYKGIEAQNLIYAAGLFDYFSDKVASAILHIMYLNLADNGVLIIVNVAKGHEHQGYMELLGGWHLHLRSEEDLLNLARDLINTKKIHVEKDKENGQNLYLVIKK